MTKNFPQARFFPEVTARWARFGRHFAAGTVVCDLHDSVAVEWESVITRRGNVRAKDRETRRCKKIRARRF